MLSTPRAHCNVLLVEFLVVEPVPPTNLNLIAIALEIGKTDYDGLSPPDNQCNACSKTHPLSSRLAPLRL